MRSLSLHLTLVSAVLVVAGAMAGGPDHNDTRLVARPGISAANVAFVYADDVWIADLDGRNARRLTTMGTVESAPFFSPDGQTIAFSARFEGNTDVYVVPTSGGTPRRLTYHPGVDIVRGFTPDGK